MHKDPATTRTTPADSDRDRTPERLHNMHRRCCTGDAIDFSGSFLYVLSLWKLRVGVEAYYLSQVASGLDDYYTGGGEAPGTWCGSGAVALSLDGDVVDNDLRAILAGLAPGTGLTPNGMQLQPHSRRVPGFDFTFAVPKSVSVAYALTPATMPRYAPSAPSVTSAASSRAGLTGPGMTIWPSGTGLKPNLP